MRASEFITEGKRPGRRALAKHEFETAHPGLVGPHANDDTYWGRYYDFYRVATLAGISFFGNLPLFSAYTEHDRKKLIAIMKKLGMKPDTLISNGSHETNGVNNVSPVKSFRGYAR
jgi:hypothetical protein